MFWRFVWQVLLTSWVCTVWDEEGILKLRHVEILVVSLLDCKKDWVPKNWCLQIVVLEKTLESPLDSKEIKPVNLKENQPWILIGSTNAEAPILWPSEVKSQLTGKDPEAGKIEGNRRRGRQRMRWLDSITNSMDMNLSKLQKWRTEEPDMLYSTWGCKEVDMT